MEFILFGMIGQHVVAVGKAEVTVESKLLGQEFRLIAEVPLADHFCGIASIFQDLRQGDLIRIQAEGIAGKERAISISIIKADSLWVTPGHQTSAGGRAECGGHIEVGEAEAFVRHPIQSRRAVGF